jgi:hypothetical protein
MASNLELVHSGQPRGGFVVSEDGSYGGRLSSQCAWVYFQHFPFMPTGLIFYSQHAVHAPVGMECLLSTISIQARIWSNNQISRYTLTLAKMVSHCELEHSSPNNWLLSSEIHLWGSIWSPSHFIYESPCKVCGEC